MPLRIGLGDDDPGAVIRAKSAPPSARRPPRPPSPFAGGRFEGCVRCSEFIGGLGDLLNFAYWTDAYSWLESLGEGDVGGVLLFVHNPHADELFRWHRNRDRITLVSLGWRPELTDAAWRAREGLPWPRPEPLHRAQRALSFYPSPEDGPALAEAAARAPYVVLAASAGTPDRNLPAAVGSDLAAEAGRRGLSVAAIGRNYAHRGAWGGRRVEPAPPAGPNVLDLIDRLSVPGTARLIEGAAGVVCSHSSMCLLSWHIGRPVFVAYDEYALRTLLPLGAVNYMFGISRTDCAHAFMADYRREQLAEWLDAARRG